MTMTPPRETTFPFTTAVFVRTTDPPMATTLFSTAPLTVIWPPIATTLRIFCPFSIVTSLPILKMLVSMEAMAAAGPSSRPKMRSKPSTL